MAISTLHLIAMLYLQEINKAIVFLLPLFVNKGSIFYEKIVKNNKKLLTNDNFGAITMMKSAKGVVFMKTDKSILITQCVIKACYALLAVVAVALPFLLSNGFFHFEILSQIKSYIIGPFYAVVPAGYVALACLDKLLINIKKDIVFDAKNVKLLKSISLACAFAGFVGLASFVFILIEDFMFETMLVLSAGEFFMALVVRVVKNVFEKAIELKEENDLTI